MHLIAQVVWLSMPLLIAGGIHMVLVKRNALPFLRLPLDGHATFRGRRLFGENKTWRGVAIMIPGCIILVGLQTLLWWQFSAIRDLSFFDYSARSPVVVGGVMAIGYLLGELPNSFIKRQAGIEPGVTWTGLKGMFFSLLDQTDSVLGFLLFMPLYWQPTWEEALAIFLVGAGLHVAFNGFFYLLGVRKRF